MQLFFYKIFWRKIHVAGLLTSLAFSWRWIWCRNVLGGMPCMSWYSHANALDCYHITWINCSCFSRISLGLMCRDFPRLILIGILLKVVLYVIIDIRRDNEFDKLQFNIWDNSRYWVQSVIERNWFNKLYSVVSFNSLDYP